MVAEKRGAQAEVAAGVPKPEAEKLAVEAAAAADRSDASAAGAAGPVVLAVVAVQEPRRTVEPLVGVTQSKRGIVVRDAPTQAAAVEEEAIPGHRRAAVAVVARQPVVVAAVAVAVVAGWVVAVVAARLDGDDVEHRRSDPCSPPAGST